MVERLTSNYTDLKNCHKVREKSVLFTENVLNRCLLSAHAVNWYYQNLLFSCVLSALTASSIRLKCVILPTRLEKDSIKPWFPKGSVFNDFSYRTTKTLIFKPVLESKVVVNIFDYH